MREIARILCGDHLHGTDTDKSRRHYKIVYMPEGTDILLQQAEALDAEEALKARKRLIKDAELSDEPMVELTSFRRFLHLVCRGDFPALDMLFAPKEFHVGQPEGEWYALKAKTQLKNWLHAGPRSFLEYLTVGAMELKHSRAYEFAETHEKILELVQTGNITFPRPNKRVLTAIREGKIPIEKVEALLKDNVEQIRKAIDISELPKEPNWKLANQLIANFYRSTVLSSDRK